MVAGLKTALIAGLISGGFNVAFYMGATLLNGGKLKISDAMSTFGDGLASGFMMGGIMAGASMALSSAFRFAASKGVLTGRRGGISLGGNGKNILSPDAIIGRNGTTVLDGGGTLINFGGRTHLDVDIRTLSNYGGLLPNYLHLHLPFVGTNSIPVLGIICGHIPVGLYESIIGGTASSNSDWYCDFKNWQRKNWRKIFGN